MLDFNKLGDMAKLASQAKQLQEKQERMQQEQTAVLKKISDQLEQVIGMLKERR